MFASAYRPFIRKLNKSMCIEKNYISEYKFLIDIFNKDCVNFCLPRLQIIFDESEKFWINNLNKIHEKHVKYLLIAESPPWSCEGDFFYIYNPNSEARSLLRSISKAFFGELLYKKIGIAETLKKLAKHHFLIIDSVPFSMDYSLKRNRKAYKCLVNSSSKSYLSHRLNNQGINWDNNLKIAFSVKNNAKNIIEALNGKITFESINKTLDIKGSNIAVNKAGYPCDIKLKSIYELND